MPLIELSSFAGPRTKNDADEQEQDDGKDVHQLLHHIAELYLPTMLGTDAPFCRTLSMPEK